MEERRKNVRTPMESNMILKRLDNGEDEKVAIVVNDVSKTGVGFFSRDVLTIGAVYEAYMTIWTKEVIHAFLRIARIEMDKEGFNYGAIFVGMPESEAARIEIYQTINKEI